MANDFVCKEESLAIGNGATVSSGFQVPNWALFIGVLFPAMDDGDIGVAISRDGGTNYYPLIDPMDGSDVVVVASGSDPGWVDISDFLRFLCSKGDHADYYVRFTCAAQSSGAVTAYLAFRG